ncbi:MAG: hypothetical protein IPG92_11300 [Flavobacteriales bacterium]|nr:hypothetical protein [Flavobacteriales bacterium]
MRRTLPPLLSILLPFVLLAQPTFQRIVRSDFGQARAIDRNGSGELYVAARHTDSTTLVNAVQLIKYDPTGALVWGKLITEPDPGSLFQASAIVSTADGGVVVTGHHVVGASADSTFVIKFDGLGNVLLVRAIPRQRNQLHCL